MIKKKKSIIGIACGLFLTCALLTGILFLILDKTKDSNTSQYNATVIEVKRITEIKGSTWVIETAEYGELGILYYNAILDKQFFQEISDGAEIVFRVRKNDVKKLSGNERVYIVTLEKQNKILITLKSYNRERFKQKTVGIVVLSFFLLVFVGMTAINVKRLIKESK